MQPWAAGCGSGPFPRIYAILRPRDEAKLIADPR